MLGGSNIATAHGSFIPGIGWSEITIVVLLALLIFPSKDLPVLMKKMGGFMAVVRHQIHGVKRSFLSMEDEASQEKKKKKPDNGDSSSSER